MTLATDNIITYSDLIDKTLELIKSRCQNIDAFASSVPSTLKNGASWTLSTATVSHRVSSSGKQSSANHTLTTTATVSDSTLVTVTSDTVKSQLNSFLTSRGIYQTPDEHVSFKGIVNFYNNVSSFMAAKIMFVTNSFGAGTFVFYNSSGSTYPSCTVYDNLEQYTLSQVQTNVQEVLNSVNNVQNLHYATTTLTYNSSCSCSSSSSSSSSSSCSSSSSTYIVYMDI